MISTEKLWETNSQHPSCSPEAPSGLQDNLEPCSQVAPPAGCHGHALQAPAPVGLWHGLWGCWALSPGPEGKHKMLLARAAPVKEALVLCRLLVDLGKSPQPLQVKLFYSTCPRCRIMATLAGWGQRQSRARGSVSHRHTAAGMKTST